MIDNGFMPLCIRYSDSVIYSHFARMDISPDLHGRDTDGKTLILTDSAASVRNLRVLIFFGPHMIFIYCTLGGSP
jgi:hypothetical protein